jgi:hypothetical protein
MNPTEFRIKQTAIMDRLAAQISTLLQINPLTTDVSRLIAIAKQDNPFLRGVSEREIVKRIILPGGRNFRIEVFCPTFSEDVEDELIPGIPAQLPASWHDSGEGPFNTSEEAEDFAKAEIGVPWRVVEKTK